MIIYIIFNCVSQKVYVGQTRQRPSKRWCFHRWHLQRGTHHNAHLQRAFSKYGETAFSYHVLERCASTGELNDLEAYFIEWFRGTGYCYNIAKGGDSCALSQDTKDKLRVTSTNTTLHLRKTLPTLIHSDGRVCSPVGLTAFCVANGLSRHKLKLVLKGTHSTHRGWRLETHIRPNSRIRTTGGKLFTIQSPSGQRFDAVRNLKLFCLDKTELKYSVIVPLLHRNEYDITYKGWNIVRL